jgi:hypothetical protein
MALTDAFIRQVKHSGKPAGDKHTDGAGMYLLVKAAGKYWRFDYRFADKRKTLALGTLSRDLPCKGAAAPGQGARAVGGRPGRGLAKRAEKLPGRAGCLDGRPGEVMPCVAVHQPLIAANLLCSKRQDVRPPLDAVEAGLAADLKPSRPARAARRYRGPHHAW